MSLNKAYVSWLLCNKQLLDEVFVISMHNNQGRGRGYQPKPLPRPKKYNRNKIKQR